MYTVHRLMKYRCRTAFPNPHSVLGEVVPYIESAVLNFTTCVLCKVKLHVSKEIRRNNLQISHKSVVADFHKSS